MTFPDFLVLIGSKGANTWRARAGHISLSFDRKQYGVPTYQAQYLPKPTAMLGLPGTCWHTVLSSTIEHLCHWLVQEGQGDVLHTADWELLEAA